MAGVLLDGFGLAGYRSFLPDEVQRVGPMGKVHLLAGPNNSGKSNVLRVAYDAFGSMGSGPMLALSAADSPLGISEDENRLRLSILKRIEDDQLDEVLGGQLGHEYVRSVLRGSTFDDPTGTGIWFEFEMAEAGRWEPSEQQVRQLTSDDSSFANIDGTVAELSRALTGSRGSAIENAQGVLMRLASGLRVFEDLPLVKSIGAFRQITNAGDLDSADFDGPGLILRLAQLQNPTFSEGQNRERFDRINRFVRELFDDETASLDVPHDRQTIIVHHRGRRLPLENYGTGIHEVVILAVAATVLSKTLLCIEEPEIHLHPALQRKFLRYLVDETDNQYLIATHSAHLLDAALGSISRVRLDGSGTKISPAIEPQEVAEISADLGARASDLVQANSVVWVEGPSDRVLIRRWLELHDPSLIEGVHFSIMFYGGALLRYLSADDVAVEEFIRLPKINRNFGVVIDSDRSGRHAQLNATKKRVRKEVETLTGQSPWVTQGYTIEDYVPPELLKEAVAVAHPGAVCRWTGDRYVDPLGRSRIRHRKAPVDKVAIANEVAGRWGPSTDWPFDLKPQVAKLAKLIQKANDS